MAELHTLPVSNRPRRSGAFVRALIFGLLFDLGCLMINGTQLLLSPLAFFPFTRSFFDDAITYTKGSGGLLFVMVSQFFAPTNLVITTEGIDVEKIVKRDGAGRVESLVFPKRLVVMSNHQIYADWMYLWCLMYFARGHAHIYIMLKKSLKWIPVVGWAMQFFGFIFLARSWASDRSTLSEHLNRIAARAKKDPEDPLNLLIFPEGTLVSADTRPLSKKYADKMGIPDMVHTLLPRSTGLHTTLQTLAQIPDLHILDVTVAYPGIPRLGYGQTYYTLRSIFFDGVPPPSVHMHLTLLSVARDVPGVSATGNEQGVASEKQKTLFDLWLRERWRKKDGLMERFLTKGSLADKGVSIPIALRSTAEIMDAFCWLGPAIVLALAWNWYRGSL